MKKFYLLPLILLTSCSGGQWNKPISCLMEGDINGVDAKEVQLITYDNNRFEGIGIPVINGKFTYLFRTDTLQAYQLAVPLGRGSFLFVNFFPENEGVGFTYTAAESDYVNPLKLRAKGPLNRELNEYAEEELKRFAARFDSLLLLEERMYEEDTFNSARYIAIRKQLSTAPDDMTRTKLYQEMDILRKTDDAYSDAGREWMAASSDLEAERDTWLRQRIAKRATLAGFFKLTYSIHLAAQQQKDFSPWLELYERVFADRFVGHPFHATVENARISLGVAVGKPFIDAILPNVHGEQVKISDAIAGKIALLNMWASWCGPCITYSKQLIPIYEKYKSAGFTVVGIAREFKDDKAWRMAIERDGYVWPNLLEMDDGHNIWEQYGIGNAAGSSFLIDRDGSILAIHPSPEELEKILAEKL